MDKSINLPINKNYQVTTNNLRDSSQSKKNLLSDVSLTGTSFERFVKLCSAKHDTVMPTALHQKYIYECKS